MVIMFIVSGLHTIFFFVIRNIGSMGSHPEEPEEKAALTAKGLDLVISFVK